MSNTKILSCINMKGGVGKTTTTINIADTLVRHFNQNVLVIDMDPQFNATQALFTKFKTINEYEKLRQERKTIASVVMENRGSGVAMEAQSYTHQDLVIQLHETANRNHLYLIPGDLELIDYESSRRGAEKILASFIQENILENYDLDYILIDTPATYSIYSQAALLASNYYLVPIAPDVFSTLGYSLLHKIMRKDYALRGHDITNIGIVFTLCKEDRLGRIAVQETFEDKPHFENKITEYERIRTGKLATLMYDMEFSKDEIISLCDEFITKVV
ncbi:MULTISPECIES: ParA family protein [Bacillus amyloliquefaciens group]|uniref:ParA family protein n=1 Tax=Bacillus amyloliquefaciens group TaxID=1938374 RepID=UPI000C842B54|nr:MULTISPECIES: AAA family ATPase [Bacillus amyloliquefaciens group]MED4526060.1 AAA family ATPase [Bacillus velezensis]